MTVRKEGTAVTVLVVDDEAAVRALLASLLGARGYQVLQADSAAGGVAFLPGGRAVRWQVTEGEARLERSTWHPRFGESLANQCLVIQLKKGDRFIFDQSKNKSVPFSCGCLRLEWGQLSESEQFDG